MRPNLAWPETSAPRLPTLPRSRFEHLAADNENLPPPAGDLAALLLQAVFLDERDGHPTLQPLWAEEGMHRAYTMLRLLDSRARAQPGAAPNHEHALARSLTRGYRSLTGMPQHATAPCSPVLRELARNLVSLFGDKNGVALRTDIDRISLPAGKRRALVLCASELLLNALQHAFPASSRHARIDLSLRQLDPSRARLRVIDNGIGFPPRSPKPKPGIATGLADLLDAGLRYRRTPDGMTIAEITFPLPRL